MTEVVVGVDGRAASIGALARALEEAERRQATLRVVHAWQTPLWVGGVPGLAVDVTPSSEESEAWARKTLAEAVDGALAGRPAPPSVTLVQEVRRGAVDRELLAVGGGADLLVLGGRGHGAVASALLGSVTNAVLHKATCPVMLVPDPAPPVRPWARAVVGLDGSTGSHAALAFAADLARRDGIPLVVVHAWMLTTLPAHAPVPYAPPVWEYGDGAESWLRQEVDQHLPAGPALDVRVQAVHGSATAVLLDTAGPDDLLVIGARGRGGFSGLLLGSVASQCARHAHGALVVVRGTGPDA